MYKSFTLLRLAVKQLVLKSYLFSKLLEVLKVNLKYIRKKEDDLVGLHFPLLHPFLYENLWLTRLDLRHSRKVDSHNFLSLSTPVKTEKKERRKTLGKSATLIMHINYTLFSFRRSLNFFKPINPRQSPRVITTTNRTKFYIIINK